MSKHTPTPWEVDPDWTFGAPEIIGDGRRIVRVLYDGGSEDEEVHHNARHIVACVNALEGIPHEKVGEKVGEMVELLRRFVESSIAYMTPPPTVDADEWALIELGNIVNIHNLADEARAVLEEVKG